MSQPYSQVLRAPYSFAPASVSRLLFHRVPPRKLCSIHAQLLTAPLQTLNEEDHRVQVFRVGRSSGGMLPGFKSPLHYQLGGPESILSLLCETSIEGNSVGLLSSTSEDSRNMLRREPISHYCHLSHSSSGSPAGAIRVTLTLQLTGYIPLWKPTRGINYFSGFLQDFSCLEWWWSVLLSSYSLSRWCNLWDQEHCGILSFHLLCQHQT